jgi:histone-lysine N-methyltransferase SETD8
MPRYCCIRVSETRVVLRRVGTPRTRTVEDSTKATAEWTSSVLSNRPRGISVFWLDDHIGYGVKAVRPFKTGDPIVRYSGRLLSRADGLLLERSLPEECGNYLYFFEYKNAKYCIDATMNDGTPGRLVNHSRICPNAKAIPVEAPDGAPTILLIALRPIQPGQEIVYDYGERRKDTIQELQWLMNS